MRVVACDLHKGRFLRALALEREGGRKAIACIIDAYRSCHVRVSYSELRALGLSYRGKRSLNVCRVHLELLNAVGWRVLLDQEIDSRPETMAAGLDLTAGSP